ncbi:MAG: LTA synthase family protein [Clostridia bacterium]|nr:LTA synthase family protein [Clostridia bacterium]
MNFFKNKILKDFFIFYTFGILFLKSMMFVGVQTHVTHTRVMLFTATRYVFKYAHYRGFFYFGVILILVSFAYLFKNRKKLWYLLALNLAVSALLLFDTWYLRSYNSLTSVQLIAQATNLDNLSDSILSLIKLLDVVFVFDLPIILVFFLYQKNLYKDMPRNLLLFGITFVVSTTTVFSIVPVRDWWNKLIGDYDNVQAAVFPYDPNVTASNISPIGYHFFDIYTYWKDSEKKHLSDHDRQEIQAWFDYKKENLPDNQYKGMLKGKNLIVIQVESLEKSVINQKIEGQEITPVLNGLLKNSLYFTSIHEQVNNGMSSDADLLMNTSVYPIRSGSTFFRYPFTKYTGSMPLLLEEMGYSTFAYHPDKGAFWNWMPALTSIGFQKCIDSSNYDQTEWIGFGISDGSYFKQIEPRIAKAKQPFYSFIVTLTGHMPYKLPDQYKELKLEKSFDETYLGGYFQCAAYEDKQIGMLLDMLKKDGLLDNSVIVIYGDHEGVHRYYPEEVKKLSQGDEWWKTNEKKLPLIIYSPGLKSAEISTVGGQIDFLPTIAYLMGVEESKVENTAMGRNLLKTNKSFAVFPNRKVIHENLSKEDEKHAIRGLDIADLIIKGNYFKQ